MAIYFGARLVAVTGCLRFINLRQSLGGQPRNVEAESPFQGSFGICLLRLPGFGVGLQSFDVSGLGFGVSLPILEFLRSSGLGLIWVLGVGLELLEPGFVNVGRGFNVLRLGFEVMGLGFEVSGLAGLEAYCAGFNVF